MTPLRLQMIEDMKSAGLAAATQTVYIDAVRRLAAYYREMENRIKECQGDLFADRTSTATLCANQLRLWLASFAYALLCAVRQSRPGEPSTRA